MRAEAAAGHRTFVVVPRIGPAAGAAAGGDDEAQASWLDDLPDEDIETAWAAAAEEEHSRLTRILAPLRVGLVHGRLRAADRTQEAARIPAEAAGAPLAARRSRSEEAAAPASRRSRSQGEAARIEPPPCLPPWFVAPQQASPPPA